MAEIVLSGKLIAELVALPRRQIRTDYDREADVLYISFQKPQQANDSVMEDDGNIYHYPNGELVGITVLHASIKGQTG